MEFYIIKKNNLGQFEYIMDVKKSESVYKAIDYAYNKFGSKSNLVVVDEKTYRSEYKGKLVGYVKM